jgi:hypothetical protein
MRNPSSGGKINISQSGQREECIKEILKKKKKYLAGTSM